jgi:dTDP-4-dehydrorhamnose 3,5-epimerase-like enzyme
MKYTRANDVKFLSAPKFEELSGTLAVHQAFDTVPFDIKRMFTVCGKTGVARGGHSHIACYQYLICVTGNITVQYFDGHERHKVLLDDLSQGMLVPPGIWLDVSYETDNAILVVLCDRIYEPEDYIHEKLEFLHYKTKEEI